MSDTDLVAGNGKAADLVSYIHADETPHVGYLKTVLTEMRDRTWVGSDGTKHRGSDMIGTLWARGLEQSLGAGRVQTRKAVVGEVEHWCLQHQGGADILAQFHSLSSVDASASEAG